MARADELRLMAKVAHLYYEKNLHQAEIVDRLDLSQATVSRLLRRALKEQIVRITVSAPLGAHPELEEGLQAAYGVKEAVVVDGSGDEDQLVRDLGAAAAFYVENTLKASDVVGISSWSATLLAMVNAMQPVPSRRAGARVVQILGGMGNPAAEAHAAHLTRRLANLISGEATFLPAPGVAISGEIRRELMKDQYVQEAARLFERVSLALVGIGAVEPSRLLAASGNVFSPGELDSLRARGAVGDICLRFFDADGVPLMTPLDQRVIGMYLERLRQVKRAVGIAGGPRKVAAVRGALRGGWLNVIITDHATAAKLLEDPGPRVNHRPSRAPRGAAGGGRK